MPGKSQVRAKAGPPAAEGGVEPLEWPEWDELPPWFRDMLLLARRWAYTLDEAHERCPRRDCRNRDHCMVGHDDRGGCRGDPSERAEHRVEGMWMARTADLLYEIVGPDVEEIGT